MPLEAEEFVVNELLLPFPYVWVYIVDFQSLVLISEVVHSKT